MSASASSATRDITEPATRRLKNACERSLRPTTGTGYRSSSRIGGDLERGRRSAQIGRRQIARNNRLDAIARHPTGMGYQSGDLKDGRWRRCAGRQHETEAARWLGLIVFVAGVQMRGIRQYPHAQCNGQHKHVAPLRRVCKTKVD